MLGAPSNTQHPWINWQLRPTQKDPIEAAPHLIQTPTTTLTVPNVRAFRFSIRLLCGDEQLNGEFHSSNMRHAPRPTTPYTTPFPSSFHYQTRRHQTHSSKNRLHGGKSPKSFKTKQNTTRSIPYRIFPHWRWISGTLSDNEAWVRRENVERVIGIYSTARYYAFHFLQSFFFLKDEISGQACWSRRSFWSKGVPEVSTISFRAWWGALIIFYITHVHGN